MVFAGTLMTTIPEPPLSLVLFQLLHCNPQPGLFNLIHLNWKFSTLTSYCVKTLFYFRPNYIWGMSRSSILNRALLVFLFFGVYFPVDGKRSQLVKYKLKRSNGKYINNILFSYILQRKFTGKSYYPLGKWCDYTTTGYCK